MARRFMIRADLEGASGVVSYEQVVPGEAEYEFGRRMFHSDLLAAVRGLAAGGATDIVIYDEHYWGRNIDLELLPSHVTVIAGKPPYASDWPGGLDDSFAGMLMVGFHAMAATEGALLPHTYEADIRELRLNGQVVGEIGMEAAIAGDCDVPLVLVTGDAHGVREAQRLIQGCAGVVVKEARAADGAICHSPADTAARIFETSRQVAETPPPVMPWRVAGEVTLEVLLHDGPYADAVQATASEHLKGSLVTLHGARATDVWAEYWQIRLRAQRQSGSRN
jgi:D-amino peptidase